MKKILIPLFSFAICFLIIWKWTLGFSAFTIFSYTLNKAGATPREFPDIKLIDQNSNIFNIKNKQKYVLMNFVYLNCPYVCHKINNRIENIYHLADPEIVPSKLEFVTISFDLKNDDVAKIKKYSSYFASDTNGWTFALPYHLTQNYFDHFLQKTGVWVYQIPETGLINHSIYLFLISPDNKIIKIFDPAREDDQEITEQLNRCLRNKKI
jgi:cytochrome oxidase Cu insertion factor (SCO1/SenC/PrrC family)